MKSILGNTRKSDITFYDNGRIDISARVSKMLSLQKGNVIDVLEDDGELYLYVRFHEQVVGRHEAACFSTHLGSRHFRAWSQKLSRYIIRAGGSSLNKVALGVGAPVELPNVGIALPIIYRHILNAEK